MVVLLGMLARVARCLWAHQMATHPAWCMCMVAYRLANAEAACHSRLALRLLETAGTCASESVPAVVARRAILPYLLPAADRLVFHPCQPGQSLLALRVALCC